MTDAELLRMANSRTNSKVGFYIHASVFVIVMLVLFAINYLSSPEKAWSLYPFLGWGLGVAIHGVVAIGVFASGFKDRLLRDEIARIKSEQGTHTFTPRGSERDISQQGSF